MENKHLEIKAPFNAQPKHESIWNILQEMNSSVNYHSITDYKHQIMINIQIPHESLHWAQWKDKIHESDPNHSEKTKFDDADDDSLFLWIGTSNPKSQPVKKKSTTKKLKEQNLGAALYLSKPAAYYSGAKLGLRNKNLNIALKTEDFPPPQGAKPAISNANKPITTGTEQSKTNSRR